MDVLQLSRSIRRGSHADMVHAVMHPVLGHTLAHLGADAGPLLVPFHRALYQPFFQMRQQNPFITFREFVAGDEAAQRLLRRYLGDDQYVLATEMSGRQYFNARGRVLESLRDVDVQTGQWMSWGHWGAGPVVIDDASIPRLVPVDFPVRNRRSGVWQYPTWSVSRRRLFQNLAYVELLRRLPNQTVPTDVAGAELLRAMGTPASGPAQPIQGMAGVRLSNLQLIQTLHSGRTPAFREMEIQRGATAPVGFYVSRGPGGRAAEDARWELAARLGDPDLVNQGGFANRIGTHAAATDAVRPTTPTHPEHIVTTLSNKELVAVARADPGCVQIASRVLEVEHQRAQRALRTIDRMLRNLRVPFDWSLLRHVCGFGDPHNLIVVTPEGHAAVDFFAQFIGGGSRWNPNPRRVHVVRPRPPANPPDNLEAVDPNEFDVDYDAHEGLPRAVNAFMGFSPYQLEPVASLLSQKAVRDALRSLHVPGDQQTIDTYNHLAGCINAAMRHYGMNQALMPRLYVNGVFR